MATSRDQLIRDLKQVRRVHAHIKQSIVSNNASNECSLSASDVTHEETHNTSSDLACLEQYVQKQRTIAIPGLPRSFIVAQDWERQVREGVTGAIVWNASIVLAEVVCLLEKERSQKDAPSLGLRSDGLKNSCFSERRKQKRRVVLELGCGTGALPCLAAASFGLDCVATDALLTTDTQRNIASNQSVVIANFQEVGRLGCTEQMYRQLKEQQNCQQEDMKCQQRQQQQQQLGQQQQQQQQQERAGVISVETLDWSSDSDWTRLSKKLTNCEGQLSYILAADVIHCQPLHESFAQVLRRAIDLMLVMHANCNKCPSEMFECAEILDDSNPVCSTAAADIDDDNKRQTNAIECLVAFQVRKPQEERHFLQYVLPNFGLCAVAVTEIGGQLVRSYAAAGVEVQVWRVRRSNDVGSVGSFNENTSSGVVSIARSIPSVFEVDEGLLL